MGKGKTHWLASLSDQNETYGRHVIDRFVRSIPRIERFVDIGAGRGADISIVKAAHPACHITAIEADPRCAADLNIIGARIVASDIERERLPFPEASIDLILANQILEHTKEIFWIFDQVTRPLKIGGHFLIGVPNVASFHNRLLLLAGVHPTQHKLVSAHVRPFSKGDTLRFLETCWRGGYSLQGFAGSQFYPFPRAVARPLSTLWPTASFSIFFLLRKEIEYNGEFLDYPKAAALETNFWTGN